MITRIDSLQSATAWKHFHKYVSSLMVPGLVLLLFCSVSAPHCYAGNNSPDPATGSETVGKYTITVIGSATPQAQEWDMASASFSVSVTYTADGTDASGDIVSQSHTVSVSGAAMDTASGPDGFTQTYAGDGATATFTSSGAILPGISTAFQCLAGPSASLSAGVTMKDGTALGAGASVSVSLVCLGP